MNEVYFTACHRDLSQADVGRVGPFPKGTAEAARHFCKVLCDDRSRAQMGCPDDCTPVRFVLVEAGAEPGKAEGAAAPRQPETAIDLTALIEIRAKILAGETPPVENVKTVLEEATATIGGLVEVHEDLERHLDELRGQLTREGKHLADAVHGTERARGELEAAQACIGSLFTDALQAGDSDRVDRIFDLAPFMQQQLEQSREIADALAPPPDHTMQLDRSDNVHQLPDGSFAIDWKAGDAGDTGGTFGPAGDEEEPRLGPNGEDDEGGES